MDPTEAQDAARTILFTILLAAVALVVMGIVSERFLLRAQPIHRRAPACLPAQVASAVVELAPAAPEVATSAARPSAIHAGGTTRLRAARKEVRGKGGAELTAKQLRERTEHCKGDPLCGLGIGD